MTQPKIVVDGYNLIHAISELTRLLERDAEAARDRLVMLLADYRATRKVGVAVVFDGQRFSGQQPRPTGGVEVVFSRQPQNADARIKAMLAKQKHARSWVVVTSDNSIAIHARDFGAKVVPSQDFARQLSRSHRPQVTSSKSSEERSLSAAEVAEWMEYFRSGRNRP
jgi:predicted RNA-binding protein with PIN domain